MEAASPPSSEESEYYYLGLPSLPRLVARSSTHAWERPEMPGSSTYTGTANWYRKSLWPADRNPLLHQLWNDADSSLRIQILEAVSAATSWTAIDILRIGLNGKFNTILLVSVRPDSLTWSNAHPITLRCKKILEEHGIRNVDCEIRESVVSLCGNAISKVESTAASDTTSQLQLSSAPITASRMDIVAARVDLSDYIGTKISMRDTDTRCGTKGLYLALSPSTAAQGTPRVVALTDRHVVIDTKTDVREYRHEESQPAREVIQIDQPTYHENLRDFEESAIQYSDAAEEQRNIGREDFAAVCDRWSNDSADLADKMRPYTDASSRVIGKLLYSPQFAFAPLRSEGRGHGQWLRDWALIELLPSSHQAPLGALTNKVFVGHEARIMDILSQNKKGWAGLPTPMPLPVINGTTTLTNQYVPMSELLYPAHCASYNDEPAMLVVKYGAKGDLTVGLGNTLVSIVRVNDTMEGHMEDNSEEWAIVSASWAGNRQAAFSERGDSGSCVWDMKGRPAGIIMAGHEKNRLNDVTYAQPLERLIEDIKTHGFDVSLI